MSRPKFLSGAVIIWTNPLDLKKKKNPAVRGLKLAEARASEGRARGAGPGRRGRDLAERRGAKQGCACSVWTGPLLPRLPPPTPDLERAAGGSLGEKGPAGRAHGHGPVAAALFLLLHCQRLSQRLAAGSGCGRLGPREGRRHLWLEGKARVSSDSGLPGGARRAQVLAGRRAGTGRSPDAGSAVNGAPGSTSPSRVSDPGSASVGPALDERGRRPLALCC